MENEKVEKIVEDARQIELQTTTVKEEMNKLPIKEKIAKEVEQKCWF